MSNLTRIQPQVSQLFITQVTVDYKRCYLKKTLPISCCQHGTHGREMSQDLRKKISLHKKGEGWKQSFTISQNTVAKVVQTFKRWNCNHLTETSRSSTEVNTSSGAYIAWKMYNNFVRFYSIGLLMMSPKTKQNKSTIN